MLNGDFQIRFYLAWFSMWKYSIKKKNKNQQQQKGEIGNLCSFICSLQFLSTELFLEFLIGIQQSN